MCTDPKYLIEYKITFSTSDSMKAIFFPTLFRYSGDRKLMYDVISFNEFPPALDGMILKTIRPRDVICKLDGCTNGNIFVVDGVSVYEK